MSRLFVLLVVYQIKHFMCDYPWQTPYMLGKFKTHGWVKPLSYHAGMHALWTFVIALVWCQIYPMPTATIIILACFDFVVHFTMDRIKASPSMLGRYKTLSATDFANNPTPEDLHGNKLFWWALGFDQAVHHLTHYAIIFALIRY